MRRAWRPDVAEEVGERVDWRKTERHLGLLDEGAEGVGVAGQGLVGDLKGEGEKAGRAAIEPAAEDSGGHFGEGALDGGPVYEVGQVEGGESWLSPGCPGAPAGGMVVEAELLAAEGGRAAGLAVGFGVMAGVDGMRT